MKILKILSEQKKRTGRALHITYKYRPAPKGMKKVMALVEIDGYKVTRHIDVPA